jgi:hypothetical protein
MKRLSITLVACLALFGCNDAGLSINPTAGSPGGFGLVDTVPQIAGEWLAEATVTFNSCGALAGVPPDEMQLLIDQADTAIAIDVITPCEGKSGTSTGTLSPSNVLNLSSSRTVVVSQRCTLDRVETVTGFASNTGDEIDGGTTVEFNPINAPGIDCGPGFPCSYKQDFSAVRCPDSGCLLGACPVSAAP